LFSPDKAAKALDKVANTLVKQPVPSSDAKISKWANFRKVNGPATRGKLVDAKDWVNGLAGGFKSMAQTIKACTVDCSASTVLDGLGNLLLSTAFVAGAACPPAGIVLAVVGLISQVVAIFLPAAKTSKIPAITAYDIQ